MMVWRPKQEGVRQAVAVTTLSQMGGMKPLARLNLLQQINAPDDHKHNGNWGS